MSDTNQKEIAAMFSSFTPTPGTVAEASDSQVYDDHFDEETCHEVEQCGMDGDHVAIDSTGEPYYDLGY